MFEMERGLSKTPSGKPRSMTQPAYASFAEFHSRSEYARFPCAHRTCGSEPIQLIRTRRSANELVFPSVPELVVGMVLEGDLPFRFDLGFGWSSVDRLRTGDIRVCLPNTEARYECGDDYSLLLLCLPAPMVENLLGVDPHVGLDVFEALSAQFALRDDVIRALVSQIWSESAQSDAASDLMVDGLTQSLVAQLLRRASTGSAKNPIWSSVWPTRRDGSIRSCGRVARARDHIEAHLGQPLSVTDLAAVAAMSPSHFSRSFKAATGEAVWAYVQRRRCEQARDMLRFTSEPIAVIAHRCGFASQAHLTSSFKRAFDVTPAAFRRS